MSNARTLASYASNFPSFRNRIINGNLSNPINQRDAGSLTASTGYTYDRWYYDGSTYLYQGIEDKNVNNGTYVISWEGSGINAAWKVSTDTTAGNGPDATTGFTSVSNGGTFTVNEGTEYSKHLWIRFDGTLANLDKVQVELGTVATPFEHRPYGMELALCQRYYYRIKNYLGDSFPYDAEATGADGWSSGGNIVYRVKSPHPVPMRVTPSYSYVNVDIWDGSQVSVTSVVKNNSTVYTRSIDYNLSGSLSSMGNVATEFVMPNGYIECKAEL